MNLSSEKWSVYVVECSDGTLYTGTSLDVDRRLTQHNSGSNGAKYTRNRRPVFERMRVEIGSRSNACRLEARIKKMNRSRKLKLIETCQTPKDVLDFAYNIKE